jgi:hypothetical protein
MDIGAETILELNSNIGDPADVQSGRLAFY